MLIVIAWRTREERRRRGTREGEKAGRSGIYSQMS
jgi:hypothetical protein